MTVYERPFGRYFEDFEPGDVYKHWPGKTITEFDDHLFCMMTMNHHPLHTDAWFAERQTQFGKNVVVGNLVYSLVLGMSVPDVSGVAIANLEVESLQHKKPTFHGDTIYAETKVLDKKESKSKADRGVVSVETRGFNQRGEEVCYFKRSVMIPKRSAAQRGAAVHIARVTVGGPTESAATGRCLFCAIVAGDAPAHIVLDEPDVVAFLDIRPVFKGHVLVVPRPRGDVARVVDAAGHDVVRRGAALRGRGRRRSGRAGIVGRAEQRREPGRAARARARRAAHQGRRSARLLLAAPEVRRRRRDVGLRRSSARRVDVTAGQRHSWSTTDRSVRLVRGLDRFANLRVDTDGGRRSS